MSGVSRRREQNIRINKTGLAKVSFVTAREEKGRGEREGTGDLAIGEFSFYATGGRWIRHEASVNQ